MPLAFLHLPSLHPINHSAYCKLIRTADTARVEKSSRRENTPTIGFRGRIPKCSLECAQLSDDLRVRWQSALFFQCNRRSLRSCGGIHRTISQGSCRIALFNSGTYLLFPGWKRESQFSSMLRHCLQIVSVIVTEFVIIMPISPKIWAHQLLQDRLFAVGI